MTACVNCTRTLQPAWKYCIFCGTRTAVAATAPRSRPLPKRTPVPGYASVTTSQTPIVPPAAPAPLSAAPVEEPVSSLWPETMGERPSLRSAIAAAEIPAPTPPVQEAPAPEGEDESAVDEAIVGDAGAPEQVDETDEVEDDAADEADEPIDDDIAPGSVLSIADLVEAEVADPETPSEDAEGDAELEAEAGTRRARSRRDRRRTTSSTGTVLEEAPAEPDADIETDTAPDVAADAEPEVLPEPRRKVNTLAVLALLIGILACPLAALFGHLALGQLKVSDERGVIPAWIAVVLGYVWLGFWIVFGISYFATNG